MIISKKMNEIVVSLVTYYPKESIRRNLAIKSIKKLTILDFFKQKHINMNNLDLYYIFKWLK